MVTFFHYIYMEEYRHHADYIPLCIKLSIYNMLTILQYIYMEEYRHHADYTPLYWWSIDNMKTILHYIYGGVYTT